MDEIEMSEMRSASMTEAELEAGVRVTRMPHGWTV